HGEEGTFTICSFWLVSALCEIGELDRARELCEKLLSYASPLQLYAEEIDPRSGRHLGNFPQAFSHLALINAVMHVIQAEQGMKTYPGLPEPRVEIVFDYEASRERYQGKSEFRIASLHLCGNTGTYVDAPIHRYRGGADLAALPLERLADLETVVVDCSGEER